jgi:hypothetical protein
MLCLIVDEDVPPPTFDEVKEVIMDMKNNKALGTDNVQAEFLNMMAVH